MSAFVCVLERSGDDVDPRELERLADPLASYGARVATFCRGPVGIAVRHNGVGGGSRHGPRVDPATGTVLALAGRFIREAGAAGDAAAERGYAPGAVARAAIVGGSAILDGDWLAGLSGPFVFVGADPGGARMEVARDHLGRLKAYYALDRRRLIAASEPAAILRHGAVSGELDEASIARFLGFRFGHTESSFFRRIRELPPGHRLRVTASEAAVESYWRCKRPGADGRPAPREVARDFRRRLRSAVAAEVAGLEPRQVALSLSGGLDSPAIAALAPPGIRAFSWTFEREPEADERPRVEAVVRHLGLSLQWVPGDGLHPLCGDFCDRFVHENSPYVNPFSALKSRLYAAARSAGCERVLVGDGGDALYAASDFWLRDSLARGRPWALGSLATTLGRAARGGLPARRALRLLLPPARPGGASRRPPWLTTAARARLPEEEPSPLAPPGHLAAARFESVAGVRHSELESEEQRLFARCGVERGNPFWSWPLLEGTLRLPAYWYRRGGRSKVLTRAALRGLLPEAVLEGERGGLLGRFFLRGIEARRDDVRELLFRRPRSDWQRYVRREWLEPHLSATRSIAFGHTILWRVISYELWTRRLVGGG